MHCHLHLKSTVQTIISKVQFFFSIRKKTYQVGLVWTTLVYPVYFGQFWFIRSTSFTSVQFGPLWSILVQFSLLQSILSTSVQFCIFSQFYPLQSIWSNLVYLLKNGKGQVLVESTINYLSNFNCNYRISFGYHNNLLKKMRK